MDNNNYFSNEHVKNIFINIRDILLKINNKEKIINDTRYNFIFNEEIPDPNYVDEYNSWLLLKNNIKNNINSEYHYYQLVSKSLNDKYHYYLYYSLEHNKYYKVMIFNDNRIIINKY